jgi:hypothetical protein
MNSSGQIEIKEIPAKERDDRITFIVGHQGRQCHEGVLELDRIKPTVLGSTVLDQSTLSQLSATVKTVN